MTSPFPHVRITAGPTSSAAVMADFMDEPLAIDRTKPVDLGSPSVSFSGDGQPVSGVRTITVPVHIYGVQQDVGRAMQQIARAISVPNRWLMLQRTPDAEPVWYRIRPKSPGELNITNAFPGDDVESYWEWKLELLTDSTAVGERRTIVPVGASSPTVTVPNEGASRGVVIDAPGEAPTPLRVDVQPNITMDGRRPLVSTYSVPWDSPLVADGEPSIIHNDDVFERYTAHSTRLSGQWFLSGGSGIGMTMDTTDYRVWAVGPASPGETDTTTGHDLEPGRYLVLARLFRLGPEGEAEVRMSEQWATRDAWQPWRTWRPTAGGDRSSWLPLGYLQHPYGQDGAGLLPEELMPPQIRIAAQVTTTSSATMILDQVAYLPVDLARGSCETSTFAQFDPGIGAGPTHKWQFDAEHRRVTTVDNFGKYHASPSPLRTGGWPIAVPGMATGVSVFLDTSDAPVGTDVPGTMTDLTIHASPRLLHVGRER